MFDSLANNRHPGPSPPQPVFSASDLEIWQTLSDEEQSTVCRLVRRGAPLSEAITAAGLHIPWPMEHDPDFP